MTGAVLDQQVERLCFEFPQPANSRREPIQVPINDESAQSLNFGLIEIGCQAAGKPAQLFSKRQLLYKLWGDQYREKMPEWKPTIYRTLAHYNPTHDHSGNLNKVQPDLVLVYHYITQGLLAQFTPEEKASLTRNKRSTISRTTR